MYLLFIVLEERSQCVSMPIQDLSATSPKFENRAVILLELLAVVGKWNWETTNEKVIRQGQSFHVPGVCRIDVCF